MQFPNKMIQSSRIGKMGSKSTGWNHKLELNSPPLFTFIHLFSSKSYTILAWNPELFLCGLGGTWPLKLVSWCLGESRYSCTSCQSIPSTTEASSLEHSLWHSAGLVTPASSKRYCPLKRKIKYGKAELFICFNVCADLTSVILKFFHV